MSDRLVLFVYQLDVKSSCKVLVLWHEPKVTASQQIEHSRRTLRDRKKIELTPLRTVKEKEVAKHRPRSCAERTLSRRAGGRVARGVGYWNMNCVRSCLSSVIGRGAVCVSSQFVDPARLVPCHSGSAKRGSKYAARITGEIIEQKVSRVQVELESVTNTPAVTLVLGTLLTWADERGRWRRYRETLILSHRLIAQSRERCWLVNLNSFQYLSAGVLGFISISLCGVRRKVSSSSI